MIYTYRGVTTNQLYRYAAPQTGADNLGRVTINGELCVPVNRDGSMARGVLAAVPGDPYSPGTAPSVWEQS
jgi:hypothetical protein